MSAIQQLKTIQKSTAFWLLVFLASMALALQYFGMLQPLNAITYTAFNQQNNNQQSNIVLIESEQLSIEHQKLIKRIAQLQPKAIVTFAHDASIEATTNDGFYYVGYNEQACQSPISNWLGLSIVFTPTNIQCHDWLDALFKLQITDEQLINFSLPAASLPKFKSSRVLSGDLFSNQIKDKIVLISQQASNYVDDINAPNLNDVSNPVYLYAYLAHSLDKQLMVNQLSNYLSIMLQLTTLIILVFINQKYSLSFNLKLALFLSGLWLLIGFLAVQYFRLLMPIAQLMIHTWLAFIWVFFHSKWVEDKHLARLVDEVKQRMFGRYLPKSIIESSSPWDAILELVNQQLSLDKSIFLARVEGDHRLQEIHAINCQLDDIKELRRDYERAPYSDAIKELGVIKVSRPFFKTLAANEQQYITPLMYAGDIRGFWALTIIQDSEFNEIAFKRNVTRFASQIGELLYHFRMYTAQQNASKQTFARALTFNLAEPLSKQISSSMAAMEQKLSTLEHIVNRQSTASVVFNLFGQIMQLNQSFEKLSQQQNLLIFDMNSLELLRAVSQLSVTEARGKLRYLTLNKSEFKMIVVLSEHHYVLRVSSIDKTSENSASDTPFSISGILFEFIDITGLLSDLQIPQLLFEQLSNKHTDTDLLDDKWDAH
ncbi:hypothetical protein PA25_08340 [Pseudoalteromonas sp. A25]|uniref:hypothetical protein n=1 Tax=Pseudoalteromonas sp. A25 TaxID=116092 RepID=UPI0012613360|nr:hypothetical protein [Pseudoalteromonas sp. A25]BBN80849.1 hypothetical protein PA25_08340 [Pseudoalteromonas sp. A25]